MPGKHCDLLIKEWNTHNLHLYIFGPNSNNLKARGRGVFWQTASDYTVLELWNTSPKEVFFYHEVLSDIFPEEDQGEFASHYVLVHFSLLYVIKYPRLDYIYRK